MNERVNANVLGTDRLGETTETEYNFDTGLPVTVDDDTTGITLVDGLTYQASGAMLTRELAIGSTNTLDQAWTYNSRMQLTQITADVDTTSLMDLTYAYGSSSQNTGRILSQTDAVQAEHSASYTYDAIYRLQQVAGGDGNSWGIAWEFDVWGNRTDQTPTGLASGKVGQPTMSYTNNRLTGASYSYDNAGNLTSEGVHGYSYNSENQLTQTTSASYPTTTYAYDGDGRRMKKTVGSDSTFYFYAMGQLVTEFSTADTGTAVAASTDRVAYNTSDTRGSAVLIVEQATGLVVENNRTLPYGEDWLLPIESANEQKFTSYLRDEEADMDYAMARSYAFRFGRFSSPDIPEFAYDLTKPQTLNLYTYTINNPISLIDPSGRCFGDILFHGWTEGEIYMFCSNLPGANSARFDMWGWDLGVKATMQEYHYSQSGGGGGGRSRAVVEQTHSRGQGSPEPGIVEQAAGVVLDAGIKAAGIVNNAPNTAIGVGYGLAGHAAGILTGTNPSVGFGDGQIQFVNNPFTTTAITLGHAGVYGPGYGPGNFNPETGTQYGIEEYQHVLQGNALGMGYIPAHLLFGSISVAKELATGNYNGFVEAWHGNWNLLEAGPHSLPPQPWP